MHIDMERERDLPLVLLTGEESMERKREGKTEKDVCVRARLVLAGRRGREERRLLFLFFFGVEKERLGPGRGRTEEEEKDGSGFGGKRLWIFAGKRDGLFTDLWRWKEPNPSKL